MKISTRGRYAVRVMIDLAENGGKGFVPLKDIAKRQEVSLKYLEGIMLALSKSRLVDAVHGKGGGYKLVKEPQEYTVFDILKVTEGDLATVACLSEGAPVCDRAKTCKTLPMWKQLDGIIADFLRSKTLKDFIKEGK